MKNQKNIIIKTDQVSLYLVKIRCLSAGVKNLSQHIGRYSFLF